MIKAERADLRSELQFLKECQVRYFFLSVAAAGAIAGFGDKIDGLEGGPSIYLAPILVILPCWWIFFDKATTISRIVAYLRVLEQQIIASEARSASLRRYIGWENALKRYRESESGDERRTKVVNYFEGVAYGILLTATFRTTHKYWSINWWTFTGLCAAALGLSYIDLNSEPSAVWFVSMLLVATSAFHNLSVAGRLTKGSYSYDRCFERWQAVL